MDNKLREEISKSYLYGNTGDRQTSPRSLGTLEYDQTFGAAGKLRLGNDNGWATCIIPSVAKPGYFLATYYDILNVDAPPRQYDAFVVRFDAAGNIDASFGNLGTGSIKAHFTKDPGKISVLRGLHETTTGDIFNWGHALWVDNQIIQHAYALTKRLSDGAPDSSFGIEGKVDIDTFAAPDAQLFDGNACIVCSSGIFVGTAEYNKSPPDFHIARLTQEGALDTAFQKDGILTPRHPDYPKKMIRIWSLAPSQDGGILACGTTHLPDGFGLGGLIMKFDTEGNLDKSFGTNGFSETEIAGQFYEFHSVCEAPPFMLVAGTSLQYARRSLVGLYGTNGSPEESFNGGKPAVHAFIDPPYLDRWHQASIAAQTPEKVIAVGSWDLPASPRGPVIGRFNMDGSVDETFVPNPAKFGTLIDADFLPNASTGFVHPRPDQILVAGESNGKPTILAVKV
uniref:Delta-60 repeat domain-containing protein n=1 Tax=Pseudomonas graminis TaxID=158627 RepID=A0A7C1WZK8_9PSED